MTIRVSIPLVAGKIERLVADMLEKALAKEHGSLATYAWTFVPPAKERPRAMTRTALMKLATTPTSIRLSKDLKKRGWTFVGPTTVYAFMQAMGLVNDHVEDCATGRAIARRRR